MADTKSWVIQNRLLGKWEVDSGDSDGVTTIIGPNINKTKTGQRAPSQTLPGLCLI